MYLHSSSHASRLFTARHLFNSVQRHPPTEIIVTSVQGVIDDRRRNLARPARQSNRTSMGSHTSASTLYDDILLQIFLVSFQSNAEMREAPMNTRAPWNLSAVCTSWRRMWLSSPSLWTQFSTDLHPHCARMDGVCVSTAPMQRIYLQLQRSEPLEINLEIRDLLCSSSKSLIRALGARSHRWASLCFLEPEVDEHLATDFPLKLPPNVEFPALRSLPSPPLHSHAFCHRL